jgi:cytochrome c553
MDKYFHQLAAALAEAGKQQDTQAQAETFNRMTESCVACHSRYVTDRFKGLEEQTIPQGWGHTTE